MYNTRESRNFAANKLAMNYTKIRLNEKQFLSLTSLSVSEFDELLPIFGAEWTAFISKKKLNGKPRLRRYAPRKADSLLSDAEKLFFILTYMKHNNVQEMQAAAFDLTQDMCNKWIHILSPLLHKSLKMYRASRNASSLQSILQEQETYIIDATERPIERPKADQEAYYSGKKKAHTVKNLLLCSLLGFVLFIGNTVEGKIHDKKIADEQLSFDKNIVCMADLGFQGLQKENMQISLPHKKPKNGELSKIHKKENTLHARQRVGVENCIGGVKILRIVKDKNRNKKLHYQDTAMDIAVALYNFRHLKRSIIAL